MNATAIAQDDSARRRNALASVVILVLTGIVILAAAYFSDPRASLSAAPGNGDVTPVTIDGVAVGAAPAIGAPAPDFVAATAAGDQVRLSDLRGRPVWLTFGASWCQPCRAENADVQAVYSQVAGQVTVVQVYMDEDAASVADYAARVGITYTTVPDPSEVLSAQYRILGIPTHFFIGADGVLRQIKVGSLAPDAMQAALAELRD